MEREPTYRKTDLVVQGVLQRIATGSLKPGDRVRSIREEAALLGIAKNTVVDAYLRLVAQGALQSHPGAGYFVSRTVVPPAHGKISPFAGIPNGGALLVEQLERRLPIRPGDGRLPADWLGDAALRRAINSIRLNTAETLNYNAARGYMPLRERLCGVLGERGISAAPDQILMTHGANHALDLIIRNYVRVGDAVLVDEPGYYPLFSKLFIAGARVIGVQRDHEGPSVEHLRAQIQASGAKMFFTQSLAHNPTGGSLTLARAYALLQVASAHDVMIIEDDPFGDILPYATPRLASLDQLNHVLYVGSFSKTLAGSFRCGYLAARRDRVDELTELAVVTIVSTSTYHERLIFSLMESGHYLKHLRRLAVRLTDAAGQTIEEVEKRGFQARRPTGPSLYLWVSVPGQAMDDNIVAKAAQEGIFVAPATAFLVSGTSDWAMRVNVAHGTSPPFLKWLTTIAHDMNIAG